MSELPQRRKSPEELAALRAKHDRRFHEASLVEESTAKQASQETEIRSAEAPASVDTPVASEAPRRLIPAKHGTVALGDEAEAALRTQPTLTSTRATKLPERRRSESELMRLRRNQTPKNEIPVQRILQMSLHPALTSLLYLLTAGMVYGTVATWLKLPPTNFYAPVGGGSVLGLISVLLYWKKPRARHHAAIVSAVAMLTMGFVILTYIKNHAP